MKNKFFLLTVIGGAIIILAIILFSGSKKQENKAPSSIIDEKSTSQSNISASPTVKEFSMDSFTEMVDGKPKPQFSLKEIVVNKGDLVKININVKSGRHDFKIDEFNVYKDTPTGQITTVEFVADKAGEFIYYCNQPGHRAAGHWGTLKVIE
ncbi:MAG: cupredoxin domain-containing protein [candidate division WOR-3 bacterium]